MRLLAIRGANLTSLPGPFALEFAAEPLQAAGLFAITGPTGAGKSTLLDAMCLALYGQVPRLAAAGHDVRQVLRHGATEGHAEVDFADGSGTAYRAKWQVWRARRRVDGRLQPHEQLLTRLDTGQPLGGTRSETLVAIRERVGLDFDQFRRSVLLAQGDFDAFLRAQPKDRASLLELITGTEIYGRISQAAHERAKAETAELTFLDRRLADIQPLSPDDRGALEAEHGETTRHAAALAERLEALRTEEVWHRKAAELQAMVDAAAEALDEAERAERDSAADRVRLARARQALPLAPLFQSARRHAERTDELKTAVTDAAEDLAKARAMVETLAGDLADKVRRADAAEQACIAAEPDLAAAADLDARISGESAHLDAARDALDRAERAAAQADADLAAVSSEHGGAGERLQALDRWLEEHAGDRALAEDVDHVSQDIDALAEARTAAREAGERVRTLRREAEALAAVADTERDALAEIDRQSADLHTPPAAPDVDPAAADMPRLMAHRDGLMRLRQAVTRMSEAARQIETQSGRLAAVESAIDAAHRSIAEDRRSADALAPAIEEAEAALAQAQRAADLATATDSDAAARLRTVLIPGQPCPVCGASEHPLGEAHGLPSGPAGPADAQADTLRSGLADLVARAAEVRERILLAEAAIGTARTQRTVTIHDLESARADWQRAWQTAQAGQSLVAGGRIPSQPGDTAPLDGLCRHIDAALAEADATIARSTQAAAERDRRSRALAQLEDARRTRQRALTEATQRLHRIGVELATVEARARECETAEARLATGLRRVLSSIEGWDQVPAQDADALKHRCAEIARTWRDRHGRRQDEAEGLARLSVTMGGLRTAAQLARADADAKRSRLETLERDVAGFNLQRAALLQGRPTATVRAELQSALAADRKAMEAARQAAADAAATAGRLGALLEERRHRLDASERDLAEANAERDRQLARVSFTAEEAEAAIALGEAWVEATRARLDALTAEVARTGTVLAERRAVLAGHIVHRPERASDALASALAETVAELEQCRRRSADLAGRLAQDDDRRRRRAAAEREAADRRARARTWFAIDDLIGSADGSTFRRIAQSLTLDRLLALANRHLVRLAPRYRLQRTAGADVDLQVVDQDMGDEMRSIASLSGGETFLASLALALALANITSGDALADCLFIDEGFGALDADSLEIAVSALEALQATGRRVGIISHIEAIMERISVQVRVQRTAPGSSTVSVIRS